MADPIKLLRRRKGQKTLTELGAEIGVSAAHVCDVLNGHRKPGPKVLNYLNLTRQKVITYKYKSKD